MYLLRRNLCLSYFASARITALNSYLRRRKDVIDIFHIGTEQSAEKEMDKNRPFLAWLRQPRQHWIASAILINGREKAELGILVAMVKSNTDFCAEGNLIPHHTCKLQPYLLS